MSAMRQFGTAILTSVISLALVVGGLSLALSENSQSAPPTAGADFFPTLTASPAVIATTETSLPATLTDTAVVIPSGTPTIFIIPPTGTVTPGVTPFVFTATSQLSAGSTNTPITVISCGPPFNWVKNYVVQPGDTLYRISLTYSTTTYEVQKANCKGSSTYIAVGERLWVPNVAPRTPAGTTIPNFPSSTPLPTEPLTLTPLPFTASPEPTYPPAPTEITPDSP